MSADRRQQKNDHPKVRRDIGCERNITAKKRLITQYLRSLVSLTTSYFAREQWRANQYHHANKHHPSEF
jgi:hypothetical protein